MQRKSKTGKRDRVSVSLDAEDMEWIRSFNQPSDSYTVSRIIKAARKAGLTLDEAMGGGVLEDFADWLSRKRKKSKLAEELQEIIEQYVQSR